MLQLIIFIQIKWSQWSSMEANFPLEFFFLFNVLARASTANSTRWKIVSTQLRFPPLPSCLKYPVIFSLWMLHVRVLFVIWITPFFSTASLSNCLWMSSNLRQTHTQKQYVGCMKKKNSDKSEWGWRGWRGKMRKKSETKLTWSFTLVPSALSVKLSCEFNASE